MVYDLTEAWIPTVSGDSDGLQLGIQVVVKSLEHVAGPVIVPYCWAFLVLLTID